MRELKTKTFFPNVYPLQFSALSLCIQVLTLPYLCFISLSFLCKIFLPHLFAHVLVHALHARASLPSPTVPCVISSAELINNVSRTSHDWKKKKKIAPGQRGMSLQGFEGSYFVHFTKALCGCSSNPGRLVRAQHPSVRLGRASLCQAQCTGELQTDR